ncbi:MAG: ERF family protein [Lachnospiraceae bacterium]|nr:ERF family protein [Lachnospiraceae bacterium]
MSEQLNLVQKLAKIRAISDVVSKEKKGFNYTYADITTILANITAGMKKYGVSLLPSIVPGTMDVSQNVVHNTKFDKTGKAYDQTATEMLVTAEMVFKWVNDDNPNEFIEVPWVVTGSQGDPSQALGSGLTYCTRYFLTNFFQIAQADTDVDTYRSKQKAAEASEDKAIAEEIIHQFDTILKKFLADNPNQTDEVKKFITKFAKNANYLAIKEPSLASKLLEDFSNKFLKGE